MNKCRSAVVFSKGRKLLSAVKNVTLLHRSSIAVFDNVSAMISRLTNFSNLIKSTERWGVASKVAGPFEEGRSSYEEVLETTAMAKAFLVT
jgi:hypothetical protein